MAPQEAISRQAIFDRIVECGGPPKTDAVAATLRATLAALGDRLPDAERTRLAEALPKRVAKVLYSHRFVAPFAVDELYARFARREGVPLGVARERVQIVCRVLGELLPASVLLALTAALPDAFSELFRPPALGHPPPYARLAMPSRHHTLASGRPGSQHPLSDSRPPGAQTSSVAEENPHGDTKLSSALGMTQERSHESLASNEPDTSHSIADARD